jgi:signal transduction histidine kinase
VVAQDARTSGGSASQDSYAQRLRLLVDAGIFFSRELHLEDVLDRIVQTASTVIGARFAALGVINEDGSGLSNFVFTGLSAFDKERIGSLPVGRGLLGAVITEPKPIRLGNLAEDPRSVGFPRNHPPMKSFLGVPIRARDSVYGNLYLTEKEGADEFSEEDERLAVVLAGQAGVAIENARLYGEARRSEAAARRRQQELELVQEVGSAVVAELDPARVLRLIAQRARTLIDADVALIALQDDMGEEFVIRVATGTRAGSLEGMRIPPSGSISGLVLTTLEPLIVDDAQTDPRAYSPVADVARAKSMLSAPLIEGGEGIGVLTLLHADVAKFDGEDLFVVKSFADLASIALQNARAVSAERDRAQLEADLAEAQLREAMRTQTLQAVIRAQEDERQRIARELHDSFGQSLASILLGLKVLDQQKTIEAVRERIADVRDVAAAAASDVRRIAFELRPTLLDDLGLEAALQRYAHDVEHRSGIGIRVDAGLGDQRLDSEVETVLYRVAQEAMTNAVKYATASQITIALTTSDGEVRLVVSDDGRGFDLSKVEGKGLGLLGMRERSELVGGKLSIRSEEGGGTTVELRVPRTHSIH